MSRRFVLRDVTRCTASFPHLTTNPSQALFNQNLRQVPPSHQLRGLQRAVRVGVHSKGYEAYATAGSFDVDKAAGGRNPPLTSTDCQCLQYALIL